MFVRQPISNKVADIIACKIYEYGLFLDGFLQQFRKTIYQLFYRKRYWNMLKQYIYSKIVLVYEYWKFLYEGVHSSEGWVSSRLLLKHKSPPFFMHNRYILIFLLTFDLISFLLFCLKRSVAESKGFLLYERKK